MLQAEAGEGHGEAGGGELQAQITADMVASLTLTLTLTHALTLTRTLPQQFDAAEAKYTEGIEQFTDVWPTAQRWVESMEQHIKAGVYGGEFIPQHLSHDTRRKRGDRKNDHDYAIQAKECLEGASLSIQHI